MDFSHTAVAVPTVIIALVLSASLGTFIVTAIFRLADRANRKADRKRGAESPELSATPETLMRGGLTIGILERVAVTALILAGYPQGIGFVVAIKGLGRFHELRDHGPRASEKFVIGTLASCLWAAAIGLGTQALITA